MSVVSILPPSVRTYVRHFDARARRLAVVSGVGWAMAAFTAWMLVCCAIDRAAHFEPATRVGLLSAGVLAVVAILRRPVRASLKRRMNWADVADRVERHAPQFGQRLVTVTSRVLGPAEHRGSDDMLREILRDVDRQASAGDPASLLPLRRVARPWLAFAFAALVFAGLMRVPGLEMRVLATRFVAPLADILPVTTTRIDVPTASRDVVQTESLRVVADVSRLPAGGLVALFVSADDGLHWSRSTMEPMDRNLSDATPTRTMRATTVPSTAPAMSPAGSSSASSVESSAAASAASDLSSSSSSWAKRASSFLLSGRSPREGGRFAFTLASVDRDLSYYVTAGDAKSRTYVVRVRRQPAVQRFAVRYEYPAYTGRAGLTVVNTEGLIEAPVGTDATLTITATEPLDDALLTIGREKIVMERVGDSATEAGDASRVRRASFVVKRDGAYDLDLISDRKVPGGGPPGTMLIRAIPDAKPIVRLPQAGENMRLHPREILPLTYQAFDDYGIEKLILTAQVNSAAPVEMPLEIAGDDRRQERQYVLDLATLPLEIGDVVTLVLTAGDRAGQRTASTPLQVLVSPRSVDLATYQRVGELNAAGALATTLHEQLTHAFADLEESDKEAASRSLAYLAALNRANRQLTGAAESATLMRQAMFRVVVNSRSAELSNAVANWIDQAQVLSWLAEDLFRRAEGPAGMGSESRSLLGQSLQTTAVLRDEVKAVAAGERAGAVLADRENLLASEQKAATTQPADVKQRLDETLARTREDIAAGAAEIGLDPAAADFEPQLKARIDAAADLLVTKQPIDFAAAAREWSQALQRDRTQPVVLDERLSAAAQAEAVRYDADLIRARDLQLAGRAAARVEWLAQADPTGRSITAGVFNEYATALAAVQREHEVSRKPAEARSPEETKLAGQGAVQGRAILRRWAGDSVEPVAQTLLGTRRRQHEVEELALRASVETAARNYAAAAEIDARLAAELDRSGESPAAAASPTTGATTIPAPTPATTEIAMATPTTAPTSAPTTSPTIPPTTTPATGTASTTSATSDATTLPTTAPTTGVSPAILATVDPSTRPAPAGPVFAERITGERHRAIRQTVWRAETIDRIGEDQQGVAAETVDARAEQAAGLAGRQRSVADAIGRVNGGGGDDALAADPNRRGRATAAVLAAQETLAAMPQHLAAAQEAMPPWREAVARAEQAKAEAEAMPDAVRQPAAQRAAAQAARDADDAAKRFEDRRRPVSPRAARRIATDLEPFAPETDGVVEVIREGLLPALQQIEDSASTGDTVEVAQAADAARQAIEAAQKELALAQEALTARDPLIAAKWFARAAADSLNKSPPDLSFAQVRQRDTTAALARAWDRAIHDAASLRMASLPSMQSVYADAPPAPPASAPTTAPAGGVDAAVAESVIGPAPAAVREWNRLRPRAADDPMGTAGLRDTDPPGFEEPLRLYFESLGKSATAPAPPAQAN